KSYIPELGYFDGSRTKWEDWWRSMLFYIAGNDITEEQVRVTSVLSRLKGGTADDAHACFLLKKHVCSDVIKTILGYPSKYHPDTYKEWVSAISSIGKGYEFTEMKHHHVTRSGITYGGRGQPMEIGRMAPQYSERKDSRCFNCGKEGHLAKNCPEPRNAHTPAKVQCYNCGKFGHISKHCRAPRRNKPSFRGLVEIQKEEEKTKEEDFSEGSK
ncbi:Gag-Pol polyprotein, partial [Leucoagaricus sp. SymC.cos]